MTTIVSLSKEHTCKYAQLYYGTVKCSIDTQLCTICKGGVCDIYESSPILELVSKDFK